VRIYVCPRPTSNGMKKILILIALVGVLAILFFAGNIGSQETIGAENGERNKSAATVAFTITPANFDFGNISMKRGNVRQMFTVTNDGDMPITIRKVTTSCMCTEAFIVQDDIRKGPFGMPGHSSVPLVNETVPAKGTLGMEVVYDPAAHGPAGIGRIERAVFIEDENGAVQTLQISATVTP